MQKRFSDEELAQKAEEVRQNSHSPYSRFAVGAAIESNTGEVFLGCNVENSSYGVTICAERVAICTGVASGVKDFQRIAISSPVPPAISPCGVCRQTLIEFMPLNGIVLLCYQGKVVEKIQLEALVPNPFQAKNLMGPQTTFKIDKTSS